MVGVSAVPVVDHHVHLFGPQGIESYSRAVGRSVGPFTADELLPVLDEAGVSRDVVLSVAYLFGCPDGPSPQDPAAVAAENDWVAEQVRAHPDRLTGFCSVNPLMESAVGELERCAGLGFAGLGELHLTNSNVDLRSEADLDRLAAVFARAGELGLPIVVHMRTQRVDYGAVDVRGFVERVLPEAASVPVQIAHAAGWGGYDSATDSALGAFADWMSRGQALATNIYFDLSAVVRRVRREAVAAAEGTPAWWPDERYRVLAERLRVIGFDRILFGSDWPEWAPKQYLSDLASELPLEQRELEQLAANVGGWVA